MSNSPEAGPRSARPPAQATVGRWILDPEHSAVRFRQKTYWGLSTVQGRFGAVSGTGEVLPDGGARGSLVVRTASLDTAHGKRDTHLRSAHFFHTEDHPELAFTADTVTPAGDGSVQVSGTLTVRDISRRTAFTARITSGDERAFTLEAEVPFDRGDFGMTWNRLGMITGPAVVTVTARYLHQV